MWQPMPGSACCQLLRTSSVRLRTSSACFSLKLVSVTLLFRCFLISDWNISWNRLIVSLIGNFPAPINWWLTMIEAFCVAEQIVLGSQQNGLFSISSSSIVWLRSVVVEYFGCGNTPPQDRALLALSTTDHNARANFYRRRFRMRLSRSNSRLTNYKTGLQLFQIFG